MSHPLRRRMSSPHFRSGRATPAGAAVSKVLRTLGIAWLTIGLSSGTVGANDAPPAAAAGAVERLDAAALAETLAQIDALISELDRRIEGAWRQAESMLSRADATNDPDEQMHLEELYGRIAVLAQDLEEQRADLSQMREVLAEAAKSAPQ